MGAHLSIRQIIALIIFLFYALIGIFARYEARALWALALLVPLHLVYWQNIRQGRHALLRNYPLLGYLRYLFEAIRPELRQYFFESDLDGKPFSRRQRALVYQRAKNERQTVPFGMQSDSQEVGFEWVAHTMFPVRASQEDLRVTIGGSRCYQPYSLSLLNISAMSYGALSKTAVAALSGGARLGHFALNIISARTETWSHLLLTNNLNSISMDTIFLTDKDYERLHQVVKVQRRSSGPIVVEALSRELKRASVVPSQEIPQNIVTMHSRVRLKDIKSPSEMEITIVYPHQADIASRKVSVLAPVGTAILGCKVGEEVKWPVAKGNLSYRIEEIIYQPEAAGDFNL